jgi:hypothetical protein
MLNGNDVQLFYKLLDSLSTSLRELAVKYELLVSAGARQASDREKTDAAVVAVAKELSTSFAAISRDLEAIKDVMASNKEASSKLAAAVDALGKSMDGIDSRLSSVARSAEAAMTTAREGKDITVHVDGHMDGFVSQISTLVAASGNIKTMLEAIEAMKKQIEPFKRLAVLFSKPTAIIVGVYVIFTTLVTCIEGCQQFRKLKGERPPVVSAAKGATNATNATNATGTARQATDAP